jgi:plastocyanin
MRYLRRPLAVVAVALLAVLGACGPAGPKVAPTAPVPTATMTMPGMTPSAVPGDRAGQPVATSTVAIRDFAFAPATITVPVGATVTWTNSDQDPHTVSATGGVFRSPTLDTGATYRYTFTKPGRYDYLCTIHPFMTATVVVTP